MSIYAKKSLGQHFLTSKTVVGDLLRAAKVDADDTVLEVGPGRGFITEELLKVAKRVVAVEKDEKMVAFLNEKFASEVKEGRLELVSKDILSFNPSHWKLEIGNWKLIGSIPYYITGKLFRTVLENTIKPQTMALIIQKEVAERAVAKDGKESLLSLGIKAFGTPRYVSTVPRQFFSPPPKVSSAVFVIDNISDAFFTQNGVSPARFFTVLRAGFAHKRKMLLPSLKEGLGAATAGLGAEKETLLSAFVACEIPEKIRPEDMTLANWGCLIKNLKV